MRHRQVPGCLAIFRVQGTQLKGTMPGGRVESAWTCRPLSRAAAAGRKWVSFPPLLIPLCRGPTLQLAMLRVFGELNTAPGLEFVH